MTQLVRIFVTKPGDLCLIPRTHMVGENDPPKKNVSSDLHSQALASITLTLAN